MVNKKYDLFSGGFAALVADSFFFFSSPYFQLQIDDERFEDAEESEGEAHSHL